MVFVHSWIEGCFDAVTFLEPTDPSGAARLKDMCETNGARMSHYANVALLAFLALIGITIGLAILRAGPN